MASLESETETETASPRAGTEEGLILWGGGLGGRGGGGEEGGWVGCGQGVVWEGGSMMDFNGGGTWTG